MLFRNYILPIKMIKKGTKLYSILNFRCPQCQEGDFFVSSPYNIKKIGELHSNCNSCKLKFSKEPGFYFGALYVSYAIGIAIFICVFVINWILNLNATLMQTLLTVGAVLIVGTPFIFHLSKIIWANLFFHYKVKL